MFNRLLVIGVAVSFSTLCNAAPIIVNGDFETPVLTSPFYDTNAAHVTGWTHTGSVGDAALWAVGYDDGGGSITTAGSGKQFVTLGGGFGTANSASWSTSITGLTAGNTYTLSFMIANEGADTGGLTQSLTVSFPAGSSTGSQMFSAAPNSRNYWRIWLPEQENFVATASAATVMFSVSNQAYDMGLDNVSASAFVTNTPEPGSLSLIASFVSVTLALRRNHTSEPRRPPV